MSDPGHYPIIQPSGDEGERIVIPEPDGSENLFDVLFYFDVPETDKSYVVVTPSEEADEDADEEDVFAFRYEGEDDDFKLFPIETDEEWDVVEEMINTFSDEEDV
ncbi:DUF1292 domain-containing protein [Sporolactobacillus sp. Y61]|jgi:uncharacterized protein YrzB (UPF0473 family)|uniref:UPF0473 protein ABNN70_13115 n=1 Tax=Sporolactobacillus sp. Y61 TaxID=3160863 RepID=A0AAU8IEF1_9BACL|nr:DUF1292 domain-containing protein [Sporolactobacillus sp. THM19-2]RYL94740.1 DUF1292 domain-containing protein [Sporolactobacillus sp. THM19-2]